MFIHIEGTNLPERRCNPSPGAGPYENIHIGIGNRGIGEELVPGDAESASWRVEVRPLEVADGTFDYRGRLVQGKRGDRFVYLNWGEVDQAGRFKMFRRGKVMLSDLEPSLVRRALAEMGDLRVRLNLTDRKGNPSCARFAPLEATLLPQS